jgi:anthranilate synthase/aminodeoxychorismate synthase-like glutamine amidotransferase
VASPRSGGPSPRSGGPSPRSEGPSPRSEGPRVVVVDNYDSFTYNLVQYLGELHAEPLVYRHDAITVDGIAELEPDAILISPGPGRPSDAGISNAVIEQLGPRIPLFGVCLGHQCIGEVFGGTIVRAPQVMHGKTSWVRHEGAGVLAGLPSPFEATRYHSLVVERETLPEVLEVTAESEDGVIMGLRHRQYPIEGVQFHPESILTSVGKELLGNFLGSLPVG